MTKEELKEIFEFAKIDKLDVVLELTVPTRNEPEIIIVKNGNLDYKLQYYIENYDDELRLKRCPEIRILQAYEIDFVISE